MLSQSDTETDSVRLLYERANSSVMSRLLNWNTDVEERTERSRAFHVDAAAHWKDRSPTVERIVRGIIRSEDETERSRWRVSLCASKTHCSREVRYSGAEPWRYRYVSVPQAGM